MTKSVYIVITMGGSWGPQELGRDRVACIKVPKNYDPSAERAGGLPLDVLVYLEK